MSDEIKLEETPATTPDGEEAGKAVEPVVTEEAPPSVSEPAPEPETAPEPQTAHPALDEPFTPESITESKPEIEEIKPKSQDSSNPIREIKAQAELAVQNRKRKKLDLVLALFDKKSKITNDEVEKLLHVSDATATRYLSILKKEGRIQQMGKTGKGVSYSKL